MIHPFGIYVFHRCNEGPFLSRLKALDIGRCRADAVAFCVVESKASLQVERYSLRIILNNPRYLAMDQVELLQFQVAGARQTPLIRHVSILCDHEPYHHANDAYDTYNDGDYAQEQRYPLR